jgi:DNA-directed RNA polymerase I subunit RPA1
LSLAHSAESGAALQREGHNPKAELPRFQARKLSVKRVTATEILDRQGNAVPDGLYDPAMGPTDPKGACSSRRVCAAAAPADASCAPLAPGACATCRLGYAHCPGHFGHIELPLPVYNPLTFGTVLRLLRAQCMHCAGFRLAHKRTETYRRKLRLLARGKLTEAMALPLLPRASKKADREAAMEMDDEAEAAEPASEEEEEEDAAEAAAAVAAACAEGPTPAPPAWTSHSWGEARALMTDFLARQPTVCENCGCRSPALSAEAPVKIHRKPLPAKARGANLAAARADVEADLAMLWRGLMAEIGGTDAAAAEAPAVDSEAEASSEDEDDEDDDEEGDGSEEAAAAPEDADEVEEEDGPESDKPRKKSGGKKKDGGAAARPASAYARPQRAGPGPKLILLTPLEARALLRKLWQAEPGWLALAYAADADVAARAAALPANAPPPPLPDPGCLFMQTLLVPPNKLRPPSRLGEMTFEHPQNEQYKAVLVACTRLADHFRPRGEMDERAAAAAAVMDETPGAAAVRAVRTWLEMQNGVVRLLGAGGAGAAGGDGGTGIKQQLERKQGLFRMNMMGKRVNYAARSVISPDPFLAPGEIGVPPFVACKLTFPELVTPHNVEMLRAAVMNGPDAYPGATAVENEAGRVLQLAHLSAAKRAALAKTLLAAPSAAASAGGGRGRAGAKAVYRHLIDGDVLLTNRQPTLHKPGVMAHRARVLAGQRTIRMHYANCATFNADFDGDEINLHLPQEHHGRAEAYGIVAADAQFCVPTDGKPIRGLIQDHVVAGVLLTMRGTFLTREQFSALLYTASLSLPGGLPREVLAGGGAAATKKRPAVRVVSGGLSLPLPTPCLLKPAPLWSGKQLLTALLALLADGRPAVTTSAKGKVPDDYWGAASGEDTLVVHRGEVVKGVLDKNAFAKYGLVHSVAELYGSADAGRLLAALSRLLTGFLAEHGFTCGLDDLMLTASAELERAQALAAADGVAAAAAEEFAFGGAPPRAPGAPPRTQEEVRKELVARLRERAGAEAGLDSKSTGCVCFAALCHCVSLHSHWLRCRPLNKIASATIKTCLPRGQARPFAPPMRSAQLLGGVCG